MIEKVVKHLGINIGTLFQIKKDSGESSAVYKFTNNELLQKENGVWTAAPMFTIYYLVMGIYSIKVLS